MANLQQYDVLKKCFEGAGVGEEEQRETFAWMGQMGVQSLGVTEALHLSMSGSMKTAFKQLPAALAEMRAISEAHIDGVRAAADEKLSGFGDVAMRMSAEIRDASDQQSRSSQALAAAADAVRTGAGELLDQVRIASGEGAQAGAEEAIGISLPPVLERAVGGVAADLLGEVKSLVRAEIEASRRSDMRSNAAIAAAGLAVSLALVWSGIDLGRGMGRSEMSAEAGSWQEFAARPDAAEIIKLLKLNADIRESAIASCDRNPKNRFRAEGGGEGCFVPLWTGGPGLARPPASAGTLGAVFADATAWLRNNVLLAMLAALLAGAFGMFWRLRP